MHKQSDDPFDNSQIPSTVIDDQQLINKALNGDKHSFEMLIERHQPWIYNVTLRMVLSHSDAEDVTQEILIKVITKLGTYDPSRSAFRTWLYRIVVNHVLDMKSRGAEVLFDDIDSFYDSLTSLPDQNPASIPDSERLVQEVMVGCVMGTLLCLDRKHRIAFILGVIFGVEDGVGEEIMEISRSNYRQMLSRARAKVYNFMNDRCSLVDKSNPCRCRNSLRVLLDLNLHEPGSLPFLDDEAPSVEEMVGRRSMSLKNELDHQCERMFKRHPFYKPPEIMPWLNKVLSSKELRTHFSRVKFKM